MFISNKNKLNYYITFLIYNAKISDNNAESGKVPRIACSVSTLNGKGNPQKGIS
jgi:hypothetical protein